MRATVGLVALLVVIQSFANAEAPPPCSRNDSKVAKQILEEVSVRLRLIFTSIGMYRIRRQHFQGQISRFCTMQRCIT